MAPAVVTLEHDRRTGPVCRRVVLLKPGRAEHDRVVCEASEKQRHAFLYVISGLQVATGVVSDGPGVFALIGEAIQLEWAAEVVDRKTVLFRLGAVHDSISLATGVEQGVGFGRTVFGGHSGQQFRRAGSLVLGVNGHLEDRHLRNSDRQGKFGIREDRCRVHRSRQRQSA